MTAIHDGRQSVARYIKNTHPSWDAASYTVKKLVAVKKHVIHCIYTSHTCFIFFFNFFSFNFSSRSYILHANKSSVCPAGQIPIIMAFDLGLHCLDKYHLEDACHLRGKKNTKVFFLLKTVAFVLKASQQFKYRY